MTLCLTEKYDRLQDQMIPILEILDTATTCLQRSDSWNASTSLLCKPTSLQLIPLSSSWCQRDNSTGSMMSRVLRERCAEQFEMPLPELEHMYNCTLEQIFYLIAASWWFHFIVLLLSRVVAYSAFRVCALSHWRELNSGRIGCIVYCDENGIQDDQNIVRKRIRGLKKRVKFEIGARVGSVVVALLLTALVSSKLFSTEIF